MNNITPLVPEKVAQYIDKKRLYLSLPTGAPCIVLFMNIETLQRLVIDALEDVKAQDIKVFSTTHMTGLFDRVAIASGTSNGKPAL